MKGTVIFFFFFFQAEDGIRDSSVTGVQTCALPICTKQLFAMGPAASQIAIKQLGTNGGGFFNVNSAHPFENPTAWTNLVELFVILMIQAVGFSNGWAEFTLKKPPPLVPSCLN